MMSSLFPLPVMTTPEEVILSLPRCVIGGCTTVKSPESSMFFALQLQIVSAVSLSHNALFYG